MKDSKIEFTFFLLLAFSIGALLILNNEKIEEPFQDKEAEIMLDYDKKFIPYLYSVTTNDQEKACTQIGPLADAWQTLETNLDWRLPNEETKEDLYLAKQWLFDAFETQETGSHRYVCLDLSRFYLMEIRRKMNIDYYFDYLWELDAAIELVHEPAVDPKFCLLEYCELNKLVNDLNRDWERFDNATPSQMFLDKMQISQRHITKEKEDLRNALYEFNLAMETAMADEIAAAADNLDVEYIKFLKIFTKNNVPNHGIAVATTPLGLAN